MLQGSLFVTKHYIQYHTGYKGWQPGGIIGFLERKFRWLVYGLIGSFIVPGGYLFWGFGDWDVEG